MTKKRQLHQTSRSAGQNASFGHEKAPLRKSRGLKVFIAASVGLLIGAASLSTIGKSLPEPTFAKANKQEINEAPLKVKSLSYTNFEEKNVAKPFETEEMLIERMQENAAKFIADHYRKVSQEDAEEIVEQAFVSGKNHDVDPLLILAVIATESSFNPKAGSSVGAKGLMQVNTKVHAKRFKQYGGVRAVHDVEAGIEVGTQILKEYLNKTGSLKGALKYYVGAAKLSHDGGYSRKVLSMRSHLRLAASGEVEAAKIQAKAPSKFPENYRDNKIFATYDSNLRRAMAESLSKQESGSSTENSAT